MANKLLIKKPHITEKATDLVAMNKYVFVVAKDATAPEVKKAITEIYKVTPKKVQMLNAKPKKRRVGRSIGIKPGYRKAIVTLKEGDSIELAV